MKLVTPKYSAGFLGGEKPIPLSTMTYWRKKGIGPEYIKIGRTVRYTLEGLHRFLEENKH